MSIERKSGTRYSTVTERRNHSFVLDGWNITLELSATTYACTDPEPYTNFFLRAVVKNETDYFIGSIWIDEVGAEWSWDKRAKNGSMRKNDATALSDLPDRILAFHLSPEGQRGMLAETSDRAEEEIAKLYERIAELSAWRQTLQDAIIALEQ